MKKFSVTAKLRLMVQFDEDKATEKSAEHVATNIALNILKEGSSKTVGRFSVVSSEDEIEILSVYEVKPSCTEKKGKR